AATASSGSWVGAAWPRSTSPTISSMIGPSTAAQSVPPLLRRSGYALPDLHALAGSERASRGGFPHGGRGSAAPWAAGAHHGVRDAGPRWRAPLARPGDRGRAEAGREADPEARVIEIVHPDPGRKPRDHGPCE